MDFIAVEITEQISKKDLILLSQFKKENYLPVQVSPEGCASVHLKIQECDCICVTP